MKTVLLWGNQWWLPGRAEPIAFADSAEAADSLAAYGEGETIRLVYQPDTFESVSVICPQAGRATLAAALAAEFPALGRRDHAWSHEPILPVGGEFSTLLHFEREPLLFDLVGKLAQRGIGVHSVWPLATFLHALPTDWTETGAQTVIAIDAQRALAYTHPADGPRQIRQWSGDAAAMEAERWTASLFAQNPNEPVLLVTPSGAPREENAEETTPPGLRRLSISQALARPVVLHRKHPAQLLPPAPVFTAQRAVIAASLAFLLAGAWSGFGYARDCLAWRAEGENREQRKTALRAEVAHLRANAREIAALRANLPGSGASPRAGALLRRLSDTLPTAITLASIKASGGAFTLTGWISPDAPAGCFDAWTRRLADGPLRIDPASTKYADGKFTVNGTFNG